MVCAEVPFGCGFAALGNTSLFQVVAGGSGVRNAPVASNMVASALRTTAGRVQQGPHINQASSKVARLSHT